MTDLAVGLLCHKYFSDNFSLVDHFCVFSWDRFLILEFFFFLKIPNFLIFNPYISTNPGRYTPIPYSPLLTFLPRGHPPNHFDIEIFCLKIPNILIFNPYISTNPGTPRSHIVPFKFQNFTFLPRWHPPNHFEFEILPENPKFLISLFLPDGTSLIILIYWNFTWKSQIFILILHPDPI